MLVLKAVLLLGDGSPELSPESLLLKLLDGMSKLRGVIDDLDFFNRLPLRTLGDFGGFGGWWVI